MYKLLTLTLTLLFFVQDIVASDNQPAIVTFIEAKPVSDQTTNDGELHDGENSKFFQFLEQRNGSDKNEPTLPVFKEFTQEELRQHLAKSAEEQRKTHQELSSFAQEYGYKCS